MEAISRPNRGNNGNDIATLRHNNDGNRVTPMPDNSIDSNNSQNTTINRDTPELINGKNIGTNSTVTPRQVANGQHYAM